MIVRTEPTVLSEPRPRPIFCVIEHAYQDRARAEAVCLGRFTEAGITLDLGLEPDWLAAEFPPDNEWRIEWSKFYYGLDLAHAFNATGDSKFLHTWKRLVLSWIRQVPVDHDNSDVTGRRVQNWIYAWNGFAASPEFPGFSAGTADTIMESLADQVGYLRDHLTRERNHRTLELYALFVASLALPELRNVEALLDFSVRELHANLLADIREDGVHRESSTHYHLIALRTFLAARENGRRFGVHFPDGYDDRLARACEFALHCHRPDGAIPALSDADTGSYADLLELAASLLGRPDFLYGATAGARGTPPRHCHASFADGGYFMQRSGWGSGETPFRHERFLVFDCGPLGDGGHGHYDLLNVEISAGGRPLVVDPGRYTYSEEPPNWRRWFKGTPAHNTVCVDGLDQTPYRLSRPRGPVAQGRFLERFSAPGLDMLCGEARSPVYEAIHTRRILFVGNEYWIIADRLRGERRHRYDLRFHLSPEAWERTTATVRSGNAVVHAPGLALAFFPPFDLRIEPGWVAPEYGRKLPAPVVSVSVEAVDADFVTVVLPFRAGGPVPAVRVAADVTLRTGAAVIEVFGALHATRDLVAWNPSPQPVGFGPLPCDAAAAWLRESVAGERLAFRACGVPRPSTGPSNSTGSGWVMWDRQGEIISGPDDRS